MAARRKRLLNGTSTCKFEEFKYQRLLTFPHKQKFTQSLNMDNASYCSAFTSALRQKGLGSRGSAMNTPISDEVSFNNRLNISSGNSSDKMTDKKTDIDEWDERKDGEGLCPTNSKVFKRDDSGYTSDENSDSSLGDRKDDCSMTVDDGCAEICQCNMPLKILNSSNSDRTRTSSGHPKLIIKNELGVNSANDETDESDVIVVNDAHCLTKQTQPDNIDQTSAWAKHSWNSPIEDKLIKFGSLDNASSIFSFCRNEKPDEEKEILIPHKYADRPEGDTFGARIWTYKITLKDGKCYYQHFFRKVEPDQPAAKMKIRDNDELVLLNAVFVPELKQVDVLNLFHKVKVDGKTRLTLVIRRVLGDASRRKEKKWEWIETSAILAPDVHSTGTDHVEVEKPLFRELTDGELEPTERLYKVPGTQLYMDIKTDRVFADFMTNTSCDKTKHIVKRARLRQNPKYPDGPIYIYEAALCNFEGKFYVGLSEADIISVVTMPVWFGMSYSGNEVHFRLHDKFLGCNKQTGKIETKDSTFSFEEISPNNGTDVPDGNPREVDREVDMRENSSSVRDSENEIDMDNLATGATVNDFGNILDVTNEMPVDDKFKSESRIRDPVLSCEASPLSSNTSMASCGSTDSGYESSSRVKRLPWNRKAQPACKVKLEF